eukprot:scpid26755/ scgid31925/ 
MCCRCCHSINLDNSRRRECGVCGPVDGSHWLHCNQPQCSRSATVHSAGVVLFCTSGCWTGRFTAVTLFHADCLLLFLLLFVVCAQTYLAGSSRYLYIISVIAIT